MCLKKSKFEYSPLRAVLADNVKKKTKYKEGEYLKKKDKKLIHNKNWMNDFKFFLKKINKLKAADPQTNETKVLKPKVLDNVEDLFNELYYIYKDRSNEEKDGLKAKNKKLLYYKKMRLTDDYQHEWRRKRAAD